MERTGSEPYLDPEKGILDRDDLDRTCWPEADEDVNMYLLRYATKSGPDGRPIQQKGAVLDIQAVNPDDPKRTKGNVVVFWWPRKMALALKQRLYSRAAEIDNTDEALIMRYQAERKKARTLFRAIEGASKPMVKTCTTEMNMIKVRQEALEARWMEEDC